MELKIRRNTTPTAQAEDLHPAHGTGPLALTKPQTEAPKSERLWSLDALRGADMMFIMGLSGLITAICKWAGAPDCALVQQMKHVEWVGLAHHDTIFPLFLFIAGVAWPFSLASQREKGRSTGRIVGKILCRALLLVLIGLIYNGCLGNFNAIRVPSVLARIGLGWAGAALVFLFVRRNWARLLIAVSLLVGYWAILYFVRAPGVSPEAWPFAPETNIAGWIDRQLLPGLAMTPTDPEGILSTMAGVVTAMLGAFSGEIVRSSLSGGRKTVRLLLFAVVLAGAGWAALPWCPCIKKLWSPTFALFVGAYSAAVFALFYWVIDVLGFRRWTLFFRVIGMNAIAIYLFQRLFDVNRAANLLVGGTVKWLGAPIGPVVSYAAYIAVCWTVLYLMYRKKMFFKV